MNLGANGSLCASLPFKRENNELNIRRDLKGGLKRKALLATSALVPVAMANLLFTPEAEAVTLDRDYFRELPEFGRVLYHAVNAVEWEIDEETGALKVLFDDGWRGVFEVGEFCFDGDELFLWPENIFIQAFPVHAVWNVLWGHPAGVMAGGGIWWLLGRNDPPVAVDDALAFTEGDNQGDNEETLSFNVLGDDYDENNDTISLLPFADVTGTFGRFTMNAAGTDIEYHFLDDINATNLAEGETGTDTARYQIQDEHGLTDTATLTVTVTGINKQVVDGNEPSEKPNDGDMTENGSFSTDLLKNASDADGGVPFISAVAGGTLGEAVAANGGGSFTITANGVASFAPGSDFDYLDEGDTTTVSINYTVSDGRGSTTSSTVTITIIGENDPISDGNESYTDSSVLAVTENKGISTGLNVLDNVTDKDANDTKHVSDNGTKISGTKTYSGSEGGTFTLTAGGAMTFDPGSAFDKLGKGATTTTGFTYEVTDGDTTDTSTVTVKVTGVNDAPVPVVDVATFVEDNTGQATQKFSAVNNDTDVDGSTLVLKAFTNVTTTYGSFAKTSSENDIQYTLNSSLAVVQALAKSETVSETASYSITDNQGGTATTGKVTAKIQGVNDKPSAVDFKGSFKEGSGSSRQTFDAMESASDVDSDVTADNKNDKLTITLGSTATSHGTFALTADEHKISYTFDDDDSLDDLDTGSKTTETIKYKVTDQHGATTEKTITITIDGLNDNTDPEAKDISLSFTEDTAKATSFNVPSNISDADNDTLTVSFTDKTGTYGAFSQTTNGDIQYAFADTAAAQSLKAGETKTETATYTVSDGNGGTDTGTLKVTIKGVNDAPTAKDLTGAMTEDATNSISFNVIGASTDVDNDAVISALPIDTTGSEGTFTLGTNGSVSYSLASSDFDYLEAGKTAKDKATYKVQDEHGATGTATITVTITGVNDAPTVETKANDIALQDTQTENDAVFLVPADGGGYEATAGSSIGLTFDDVDDSSLALTASGLQTGWSFTSNGSIAGTAALTDPLKAETHTVTVKATDDGDANGSNKLSASDTLDIYIGLNISGSNGGIVKETSYTIEGSDVADDDVDLTLDNLGAGAGNEVTIDLGDGENYFKTRYEAASSGGKISYTGGDGSDELRFLQFVAKDKGEVTINAGNGYNKLYLGNEAAGDGGSITYTGGTGTDEIETNNKLAHGNGEVTFDLGSDTSKDVIIFNNSVAPNNGVVIIQNFDAGEGGTAAEDEMIFKKLDNVDDLDFEQSGSDVIVQSTGSADVYVKLIVADASTSDFNLSIDSNGDLLIN